MQLFDFDDILIEPSTLTDIRSRKTISSRYENGMLPIMTAPMDTVVDLQNHNLFRKNGILPVLPRIQNPTEDWIDTELFLSYSLEDFERLFMKSTIKIPKESSALVLIDIANGHMRDLHTISKEAKKKYGSEITLMVGNVANPDTFYEYCLSGMDYVRIGIGNGNGCLTTVQTGVGYPMASLIQECNKVKTGQSWIKTKIVADGGFKKYSDVIKALALGADYVMLGSILNKALESCGETTRIIDALGNHETINQYDDLSMQMFDSDIPLYKVFRGMSTKEVQKNWGKTELTTSEGVVRQQKVEYTLNGWVNNFESYLKSAMSYTGKKELHQFIGGVKCNHISMNAFKRFDK
jgi:IMP dehydrogenase/GMP reductase